MAHSTSILSTRASANGSSARANGISGRHRPTTKRPLLVVLALAVLLLAVGGWVVRAFKALA